MIHERDIVVIVVYYVFLAFAGGMPPPAPGASQSYVWLYSTLRILCGDLNRFMPQRLKVVPEPLVTDKETEKK